MGTDKRERQRANKALKQQQVAKAEARSKSLRLGIIVVGAIVAVIAIAFAANVFVGDDDSTADETLPFDEETQGDVLDPAVDEPAVDEPVGDEPAVEAPPADSTKLT